MCSIRERRSAKFSDWIIHQPRMLLFSDFLKQQKPQTIPKPKELFEVKRWHYAQVIM